MGPPRHLALIPETGARRVEWPVPFADGIPILTGLRGKRVVVLVSGDPFWFGAGSVIARHLQPQEWTALPGASAFSLAAARLGWPLETTATLGLHAAPLSRLRPHLSEGRQIIVLLRGSASVRELADWLTAQGFGRTVIHVMEALGGPREKVRSARATEAVFGDITHPVCAALEVFGDGSTIPLASGRPDDVFEHDGQITKRPVRALTLSALAPCHGEHLWDIGGGSGSIALEWLMSDPSLTATSFEPRRDRADRIRRNADALGQDRLEVVQGSAPECLNDRPPPDAVFIGGGLSEDMLDWLFSRLPPGTRLVANAVTLESESLLASAQARTGGTLLRVELAQSAPLGGKRGWQSAYPVIQWSVTL